MAKVVLNGINFILSLLIVLSVISCGDKTSATETILLYPLNAQQSVNLSEFVDSVYFIKLETNDDIVISDKINRILIKEQYIYLVDIGQAVLFVFDKQGKFVAKLDKRGNGPDQYSFLSHIFIDDDEKYVDILDGRGDKGRILSYSNINFEFLNDRPLFIPSAISARRDSDFYYFSTQQMDNIVNSETSNADIIVVKPDEIPKEIFKKKISTEGNYYSFNSECFTVNDNGEIFISLMFDNTFYKLTNGDAYEVKSVDFGKYGIDNSMGLSNTKKQMEYLQKSTEGLASFPVLHVNNAKLLIFSYFFKQNDSGRLHYFIDFKGSKRTFHVQNINNDLTNFPEKVLLTSFHPVNHEVYHTGGYLVDIIIPSQTFEDRNTEIALEGVGIIKAEDNPVIMMMKLKNSLLVD